MFYSSVKCISSEYRQVYKMLSPYLFLNSSQRTYNTFINRVLDNNFSLFSHIYHKLIFDD